MIYISGRITRNKNWEKDFQQAEEYLKKLGFMKIINPLKLKSQVTIKQSYANYMRNDIKHLRQTNLCYQLGLIRKRIIEDGRYTDGSECAVLICKSCFSRKNNELIMRAIWKGHERSKKIRKQRGEEC